MSSIQACRSCGCEQMRVFLDLGQQPLANNLLGPDDSATEEPKFPLKVAFCPECYLVQITDTIPPIQLFGDYLYFSSFSDAMLEHAKRAADDLTERANLNSSSFVVEIASNDGYLLKNFVTAGIPCLGIEPAANIAKIAEENGVPTQCEFFGVSCAEEVKGKHGKADAILGNNVFAHVPDINDFLSGAASLLKENGQIVFEFPYLGNLIENIEFDTVYHEHVFYFSILALSPAFARHGLELFDVERLSIHGGSLRLRAGHKGMHEVTDALKQLADGERRAGMATDHYYEKFASRVRGLRDQLIELIEKLESEGRTLAAYGASAKGSTLLNYIGVGAEKIDFVVDRSTYKQGRYTPGTHILILPPDELKKRKPDYTLLLTWNFADEILEQQIDYRESGGKFIVPLPEPTIV